MLPDPRHAPAERLPFAFRQLALGEAGQAESKGCVCFDSRCSLGICCPLPKDFKEDSIAGR